MQTATLLASTSTTSRGSSAAAEAPVRPHRLRDEHALAERVLHASVQLVSSLWTSKLLGERTMLSGERTHCGSARLADELALRRKGSSQRGPCARRRGGRRRSGTAATHDLIHLGAQLVVLEPRRVVLVTGPVGVVLSRQELVTIPGDVPLGALELVGVLRRLLLLLVELSLRVTCARGRSVSAASRARGDGGRRKRRTHGGTQRTRRSSSGWCACA